MIKQVPVPDAFDTLQAWLHQDADWNAIPTPILKWIASLTRHQRNELQIFMHAVMEQEPTHPSFSRLMKTYAPDWHLPEKQLKVLFRDIVTKELEANA